MPPWFGLLPEKKNARASLFHGIGKTDVFMLFHYFFRKWNWNAVYSGISRLIGSPAFISAEPE